MKLNIAIVDDNSFLIHAIKEKLSFFEDIMVRHTALNGSELLTRLEESHCIDVILMDIEMPVLNGIETTQMVKQKYPQIKIIMLTAFDNDENIFNAIKAGADGYLLKEINPEALHKGIHETLNGGAAMNPSIALKTLKLLRNPIDIQNPRDQDLVTPLLQKICSYHQVPYASILRISIKSCKYIARLKRYKRPRITILFRRIHFAFLLPNKF